MKTPTRALRSTWHAAKNLTNMSVTKIKDTTLTEISSNIRESLVLFSTTPVVPNIGLPTTHNVQGAILIKLSLSE